MSRVLVLGNATVDVIQRVERLPLPGETVLALGMERCAGGKGLNQALAAARTGARTTLAAPVGTDRDAAFLAQSIAHEPDLSTKWVTCSATTDLSVIWVARDGENVIVSSADCARSVTPAQASTLCSSLVPGDVLLMQGNLSAAATIAAAQIAAERGATRILNTAPIAWEMQPALGLFGIVVANAGEARVLSKGAGDVGSAMRGFGVPVTIVTLGSKGALITADGFETKIDAPQVTAVDTTGAGDVFAGTLAGLLANGCVLQEAASVAVAAASLSVTRSKTTPSFPTRDELATLFGQARQMKQGHAPDA